MGTTALSVTGKVWDIRCSDPVSSENLVELLLRNRGLSEDDLVKSAEDIMPDPFVLKDMDRAVDRIIRAMDEGQTIAVLGDYDVDGISATAILIRFFNAIGVGCTYRLPDRLEDGYGLHIKNLAEYRDDLVIAVDNGSSNIEELEYARENGIDVIVLDHHTMLQIPDAVAVVNPHRPDESGDYRTLCAAGVVFFTVVALHNTLKEKGFYEHRTEPDIMSLLDVVMLATICDVMPLVGLNRAFVQKGLQLVKQRSNIGISALLDLAKDRQINSSLVAFFIGPRLNAAGRISSPNLSLQLLIATDKEEARRLAIRLHDLNEDRREMEYEILVQAEEFVDQAQRFVCAYGDDWHVGVIGVVAGRLKEKYHRPTVVISFDDSGIGHASCRSVGDVDIASIISSGIEQGIILSGGGHKVAAGFSLEKEKVPQLIQLLDDRITKEVKPQTLMADCVVSLDQISVDFVKKLSKLEPFGEQNPTPRFVLKDVNVTYSKVISGRHMSVVLVDSEGNKLRAIAFHCADTPIGRMLNTKHMSMDILGELDISAWKGHERVNLHIIDIAA